MFDIPFWQNVLTVKNSISFKFVKPNDVYNALFPLFPKPLQLPCLSSVLLKSYPKTKIVACEYDLYVISPGPVMPLGGHCSRCSAVLLLLFTISTVTNGNLFASIAGMEQLVKTESELSTILNDYIELEYERLERLKQWVIPMIITLVILVVSDESVAKDCRGS